MGVYSSNGAATIRRLWSERRWIKELGCHSVELITVTLSLSVGLISRRMHPAEGYGAALVHFKGPGAQPLIGYCSGQGGVAGRAPGIILLHGRTRPCSTAATSLYDATTLSKRHESWERYLSGTRILRASCRRLQHRGYPEGFRSILMTSVRTRSDEVTVRPFDAYAGLAYLEQVVYIRCIAHCPAGVVEWRKRHNSRNGPGDRRQSRRERK